MEAASGLPEDDTEVVVQSRASPEEMGDFLDWPPQRYLRDGLYADPDHKELRPDLNGIHALRVAFRFHYEGVQAPVAGAMAAEYRRAAEAVALAPATLAQQLQALRDRLGQEPFGDHLYVHDFYCACYPFMTDAAAVTALAGHVARVASHLAMIDVLNLANNYLPEDSQA